VKFLSLSALKAKFFKADSIVQVRILTKMRSVIEIEGPVSEAEATQILKFAMGEATQPSKQKNKG
jgi:hypothetical protein